MIGDLDDLLSDHELSEEQIRILNCKLENTFIRGLSKKETLDLIWQKVQVLVEENGIYPKEIVIVFEQEEDKEYLQRKINENLENKDDARDVEFQLFKDFENKYAPNTSDRKKTAKPMNLRAAKKIVFLIDPSLKIKRNFLQLMQWLFPENGAIFFLWEYESNFLDTFQIHRFFRGIQIINYLEYPDQTTNTYQRKDPGLRDYQGIIQNAQHLQNNGYSYNSMRIYVPQEESPSKLQDLFMQIFKNEFEFFVNWIKFLQSSERKSEVSQQLVNWPYNDNSRFIRIIDGRESLDWEKDFEDLAISENSKQRWELFKQITKNLDLFNGQKSIDDINRRIINASLNVKHSLFQRSSEITKPNLVRLEHQLTSQLSQRFLDEVNRFTPPAKDIQPPKKEIIELVSIPESKYSSVIRDLKKEQEKGASYRDFHIHVSPYSNESELQREFQNVLRNEFEYVLSWIKIIRKNKDKLLPPRELVDKIKKPNYENPSQMLKIIIRAEEGKDIQEQLTTIVQDGFLKKQLDVFNKTTKGINAFIDYDWIEKINQAIEEKSKDYRELFKTSPGTIIPKLIDAAEKPKEKPGISEEQLQERMQEYHPIIAKIEKHQTAGGSYQNFVIQVPQNEDKSVLLKVLFWILKEEFEIFVCWIKVIQSNKNSTPAEPSALIKVINWPYKNKQEIWELLTIVKKEEKMDNLREMFETSVVPKGLQKHWNWFSEIIKGIDWFQGDQTFDEISRAIEKTANTIETKLFERTPNIKYPKLLNKTRIQSQTREDIAKEINNREVVSETLKKLGQQKTVQKFNEISRERIKQQTEKLRHEQINHVNRTQIQNHKNISNEANSQRVTAITPIKIDQEVAIQRSRELNQRRIAQQNSNLKNEQINQRNEALESYRKNNNNNLKKMPGKKMILLVASSIIFVTSIVMTATLHPALCVFTVASVIAFVYIWMNT